MREIAFIQQIGVTEVLVLVLILVVLFGAKRLPALARGVAQSLTEFKKGLREGNEHGK